MAHKVKIRKFEVSNTNPTKLLYNLRYGILVESIGVAKREGKDTSGLEHIGKVVDRYIPIANRREAEANQALDIYGGATVRLIDRKNSSKKISEANAKLYGIYKSAVNLISKIKKEVGRLESQKGEENVASPATAEEKIVERLNGIEVRLSKLPEGFQYKGLCLEQVDYLKRLDKIPQNMETFAVEMEILEQMLGSLERKADTQRVASELGGNQAPKSP